MSTITTEPSIEKMDFVNYSFSSVRSKFYAGWWITNHQFHEIKWGQARPSIVSQASQWTHVCPYRVITSSCYCAPGPRSNPLRKKNMTLPDPISTSGRLGLYFFDLAWISSQTWAWNLAHGLTWFFFWENTGWPNGSTKTINSANASAAQQPNNLLAPMWPSRYVAAQLVSLYIEIDLLFYGHFEFQ